MKCFFVFFLTFASLFSTVRSLGLNIQPETLVGTPTLVIWTRDPTDVPPVEFDLRFLQAGADVGLALANIGMDVDVQSGNVLVTFPSPGQFALAAVTGNPPNTLIGMSNTITAIASVAPSSSSGSGTPPAPVPTAPSLSSSGAASSTSISATRTSSSVSATSTTTTSSSTTSATSSSFSSPTHTTSTFASGSATSTPHPISTVKQPANVTAIVAGILGVFLLIALLIALFLFLRHRRRERERILRDQRISFHKDLMVQRRHRDLPSLPTSLASSDENLGAAPPPPLGVPPRIDVDVEQGFPLPPPSPSISTRGSRERASGPSGPVPPSPIVGHLSPHPTRLGSGHIVPSPRGPRPSLKIKKTEQQTISVSPPLRSAPVVATAPSTTTKPASAAAAAAVSTRTAKRTRRQRQITDRISMLSQQMAEVKALFDAEEEEGKRGEHKRVLEDMQREMVWLRDQEEGAWALGLTDVSPPGWARYMTP